MFDLQHVPVVHNAPNHNVYAEEHALRSQDNTNTIEDGYEYAQPKSYRLVANTNFQVVNPFNTPCQLALLYARVNDATGYLALNFDNNDPSPLTIATNILDFPGLLLTQTGLAPLAPFLQWTDFHDFVNVRAQGITTFTEFCLLFRRNRKQTYAVNKIAFNSLDQ